MLSGHNQAPLARIQAQDVVVLGQATTFLDDGPTQPNAGRGTVQVQKREEYLLPLTGAFPPARVN